MRYVKVLLALAVLGAYPAAALAHKAPSRAQRSLKRRSRRAAAS